MTGFSGETTVERDVGTCLMCGSPDLTEAFRLEVEHGRFDSPYHECKECRSLQLSRVERGPPPAVPGIGDFDVGSVQRSILTALLVRALRYSRLLRRSARCLDFGAGLGLLSGSRAIKASTRGASTSSSGWRPVSPSRSNPTRPAARSTSSSCSKSSSIC
jgi:hypothetical protein